MRRLKSEDLSVRRKREKARLLNILRKDYVQKADHWISNLYTMDRDWKNLLTQDQKTLLADATLQGTQPQKLKKRPIQLGGTYYDIQQLQTKQETRRKAGVSQQDTRFLKGDDDFRLKITRLLRDNIPNRIREKTRKQGTPIVFYDRSKGPTGMGWP